MFSDILTTAVVPIVTAALGWFSNAYRNKQKKEGDIMVNFKEMMSIQTDFISRLKANIDERDETLGETKNIVKRLEAKLDQKEKSIRKANFCKYSNEGDGCPVLVHEEAKDTTICNNCEHYHDKSTN